MLDTGPLIVELDRWRDAGRTVDVWWRDDDAAKPDPALDRLVETAGRHGAELAVATVPAEMDEAGLIAALDRPFVSVIQHGFSHRNFAAAGARAVECGGDRPLDEIVEDLGRGRARLSSVFGPRFTPVMVPPWNRIERRVADALAALGYRALSVFGLRGDTGHEVGDALPHLNTHLDLLTWKGGARFAGREKSLRVAVKRLAAIREAQTGEPFGLLTHHLDHDHETWAFLDEFLALFAAHPAVAWKSAGELVAEAEQAGPVS